MQKSSLAAIVAIAFLLVLVVLEFEDVTARKIVKACWQNQTFTLADQGFECRRSGP